MFSHFDRRPACDGQTDILRQHSPCSKKIANVMIVGKLMSVLRADFLALKIFG